MTVTAAESKWGPYAGNGATVAFNAGKVFDDDDLVVYLIEDATGNADLQVKTTEYSVSGMLTNAGVVTFVTPPPAGYSVLIYRSIAKTQTSDFKNAGTFLPEFHEDRLDRLTMMVLDLQEQLDRCAKIDITNISGDDPRLPDFEDTKVLRVNGNLLEWVAIGDASVIPNSSETEHGLIELATTVEAQTGTDVSRAITPATLQAVTGTETRKGVLELATDAETITGTDTARAITPANLAARTATTTRTGIAELATDAEMLTATDTTRVLTASNVAAMKATQAQMESASSTSVFVQPGVMRYSPGVAKMWLKAGVTGNILVSHNITSLSDDGTGLLTVTIATDFSSADYAIQVSTERASTNMGEANARISNIRNSTLAAGAVTLECYDGTATTNVAKDPATWHCVGYGDQ